jgi:RNA recognition motif-containing protein
MEEEKEEKPAKGNKAEAAQDEEGDGKTELFIAGLSFDTTQSSLQSFFEQYGSLSKCKLLKGKAFVEYSNAS